MSNTHILLLTGRPGVGKTTAVRKVAERLSDYRLGGFYTELDSKKPLVATIAQKGGGFMAEIKQHKDAQLWELTHDNRDEIPEKVVAWLEKVK